MQFFVENYSAPAIAMLAFAGAMFLFRLARMKNDWSIASAAMPRLYIAGVYGWIVLFNPPADERTTPIRIALLFWLLIEVAIHLFVRRNGHDTH